jgi:hypothetical protein
MKCRNSTSHGPPPAFSRSLSLLRNKGGAPTLLPGSSQRGVALVLTLIMLAIITVVTVAFLASSRRSRQTTQVLLEQSNAEHGSEFAYHRALSEIMTNILGARAFGTNAPNLLAMDFFVSRGNGLGSVANATNSLGTIGNYLDLNRNQRFDDPNAFTNYPYGDPVWIAVNDKPWSGSAANNQALIRIAYVVQPVGKSLDLNTIHNAASPNNGYQYLRNQGFGPWELNLGAFLAELNPDVWYNTPGSGKSEYSYGPFPKPIAGGDAFIDARSIVDYRTYWGRQVEGLASVYPNAATLPPLFPPRSIDAYSDGNGGDVLGQNIFALDDDQVTPANKLTTVHWYGADATNHWFHLQDFFHATNNLVANMVPPNHTTKDFTNNLWRAINGYAPDSIVGDPISYYRMIAQLGTDTGSDFHDRINLNYVDEHATWTNLTVTNFVSWTNSDALAVTFFTNVAERIFLAQSNEFNPFPGTNSLPIRSMMEIPIFPTNQYSTAIHRILQEAANIFDATSTNIYPSVFRPMFGTKGSDATLYITNYVRDDRVSTLTAWLDSNTNGIPLIVGAKKGFPNFNEFTVRSDITMTRKLQVTRTSNAPKTPPSGTNQMYILGISNYFGVEAWNSYYNPYSRQTKLSVSNFATLWLSNDLNFQTNAILTAAKTTSIPPSAWNGYDPEIPRTNNFIMGLDTNQIFLSNAVYIFNNNTFANISTNAFETSPGFPLPYWIFTISNRVSYLMSEPMGGDERIIDFVLLNDNHTVDVFRDLVAAKDPYYQTGAGGGNVTEVWETNRVGGVASAPTDGVNRQMAISLGDYPTSNAEWRSYALTQTATEDDKNSAIDAFLVFNGRDPRGSQVWTNPALTMEAPFNPAAKLAVVTTWQANDPLVHYHQQDLRMGGTTNNHQYLKPIQVGTNISPSSLGRINDRYSPWGGKPTSSADEPSPYDRKLKDPGVFTSDDWNFPTNKLASVGLLGRIHRGTPWQTIYLKAEAAPVLGQSIGWTNVSADIAVHPNGRQFSRTHPTNDWRLMDMFTTAIDERTSRGLVSINQTNLETWSALLSGVVVLSNSMDVALLGQSREYTEMFIEPWAKRPIAQSQLAQIWTNIHAFQTNYGRPLESVGDLLQLPLLTVASPYLNHSGDQDNFGLDDYAYEQIPAQILSLLRVGSPRFVIYAYGQALKPTDIDPSTGQVRNYQITAEHATRTVIRIEGDPRTRVRAVVESFNILPPD